MKQGKSATYMMVRIVALWLFILFSLPLFAQKRVKVTGYIRDAEGNPLECQRFG